MPSFDIISEVNMHEATNGIAQANKEVANRFDFKGTNAKYEFDETTITMFASSDFQLKQMSEILFQKLSKRSIDVGCLESEKPESSGRGSRQKIALKQGIDKTLGKTVVKLIKDAKIKVQASIMEDKVRVTGKKRDDLQQIMSILKEKDLGIPIQFDNFRD